MLITVQSCNHINFDVTLLGDCDIVTGELAKRAGWDFQHNLLPPSLDVIVSPSEEGGATWIVQGLQPQALT